MYLLIDHLKIVIYKTHPKGHKVHEETSIHMLGSKVWMDGEMLFSDWIGRCDVMRQSKENVYHLKLKCR